MPKVMAAAARPRLDQFCPDTGLGNRLFVFPHRVEVD